jgi:hypothetical protein
MALLDITGLPVAMKHHNRGVQCAAERLSVDAISKASEVSGDPGVRTQCRQFLQKFIR